MNTCVRNRTPSRAARTASAEPATVVEIMAAAEAVGRATAALSDAEFAEVGELVRARRSGRLFKLESHETPMTLDELRGAVAAAIQALPPRPRF